MFGKKKNAPHDEGKGLRQDVLFINEKDTLTEKVIENLLYAHTNMTHSNNVDGNGCVKLTKYLFKIIDKKSYNLILAKTKGKES